MTERPDTTQAVEAEAGSLLWLREYQTPHDVYAHGISRVLAHHHTAYQEMMVVDTGSYGKGLVLDGKWQSAVADEFLYHEALVHPAMILHALHHAPAQRVLILGGAEGASLREVLRWRSVQQVVMVDIDGEVVDACREHLSEMHQGSFEDARAEVVIGDAWDYVAQGSGSWDVIISDLSDPIESGPSFQLFTLEFFHLIQKALSPTGFYSLQAGSVCPVEIQTHARTMHTLAQVFRHSVACLSYAPTYGVPLGLGLASEMPLTPAPDPVQVDQLLQDQITGSLRLIDGMALVGLLNPPRFMRQAVASESVVYTLADPPSSFHQEGSS